MVLYLLQYQKMNLQIKNFLFLVKTSFLNLISMHGILTKKLVYFRDNFPYYKKHGIAFFLAL